MAIIRNDPFRNFFNLQDQLFRTFDATYGAPKQEAMTATWSPLVDVFEDADGITLTAELAGVAEKDVDIQLDGNTLTLRGERTLPNEQKRDNYHRVERTYGAFARSFTLPQQVDAGNITAQSKDGVLHIHLPKKAETKPRSIKIGVGATPAVKQ
jgi:HSP20 family protein